MSLLNYKCHSNIGNVQIERVTTCDIRPTHVNDTHEFAQPLWILYSMSTPFGPVDEQHFGREAKIWVAN